MFVVAFYVFVGGLFALSANVAFPKTNPVWLMLGWPIYSTMIIYREMTDGKGKDNRGN